MNLRKLAIPAAAALAAATLCLPGSLGPAPAVAAVPAGGPATTGEVVFAGDFESGNTLA